MPKWPPINPNVSPREDVYAFIGLAPPGHDENGSSRSPLSRCSMCNLLYEEHLTETVEGDGVCSGCVESHEELVICLECGVVADTRRHEFCPSCGLTFKKED